MSTLQAVTKQLNEQEESLNSISANTSGTQKGIDKLVEYFTAGDSLERQRDAQRDGQGKSQGRAQGRTSTPIESQSGQSGQGSRFSDLATIGGIAGLTSTVGSGALKMLGRALPGALMVSFADEIGRYVESSTGSAEIGASVERGLVTGGIGTILFGKKGGIIGAILGAIATPAVLEAGKELGNEVVKATSGLLKSLSIDVPDIKTAEEAMGLLSSNLAQGITGITEIIRGDTSNLKENYQEIAGILAAPLILTKMGRGLTAATARAGIGALKAGFGLLTAWGAFLTSAPAAPPRVPTGTPGVPGTPGVNPDVKVDAQGRYRNAKGQFTQNPNKFTGFTKQFSNLTGASKFKALASVVGKQGAFSGLIGAGLIAYVINQPDLSNEEKADIIASIIQSSGGSVIGAAAGSILGPLGAAAGGILGGIYGEDMISRDGALTAANWLVSKTAELPAEALQKAISTKVFNEYTARGDLSRSMSAKENYEMRGRMDAEINQRFNAQTAAIKQARVVASAGSNIGTLMEQERRQAMGAGNGGSVNINAADNSTSTNISNPQAIVGLANIGAVDRDDMLNARSQYGM